MTPQQTEAMKLALEALKMYGKRHRATYLLGGAWDEEITLGDKAITAIEEVLAEHAMRETQRLGQEIEQERTWGGLTDEEIDSINYTSAYMLAKEVESKLKQKNGYTEEKNT